LVVPIAATLTYYLTVTDSKGCESLKNDSVKIVILPEPKVFAGRDTSISVGQQLQLNAIDISNSGFVNYNWSPSFGLSNSLVRNPLAVLDRNMTYIVTATSAEGCNATDDIKITLILVPEILVPNAFSPNNDLINNSFKPILRGIKSLKHFSIYNRYGELVFTTSTQGVGWDGTYKGKPQNIGGYVWVIEAEAFNGTAFIRKGSVVLIR
jgi:gliding motility-associated-like protein